MNRDPRLAFRRPSREISTRQMPIPDHQVLISHSTASRTEIRGTNPTIHIPVPGNRVAILPHAVANPMPIPATTIGDYPRGFQNGTTAIQTLANVSEAERNNAPIPEWQYSNSDTRTQIPPSTKPRTRDTNTSQEDVPLWHPSKIQEARCAAALVNMGRSNVVKEKLNDFLKAASELKSLVPQVVNLHCFLTCPVSNNDSCSEGSSLYPLVSRLFHVSLHAARRGSTIVGQAL